MRNELHCKMKKKLIKFIKKIMVVILILVVVVVLATLLYMQHPKFGKAPQEHRLELIKQSPNFKGESFQNVHFTPFITEGYSMTKITLNFIFGKFLRTNPIDIIPSIKTDLKAISKNENILIWFGHSSYLIQLNGKRFLVAPVFSGNASPVPYTNKSFAGTDIYTADDFHEN